LRLVGTNGKDSATRGSPTCARDGGTSVIKEFKQFIAQGDAFDLAVGIILGIAFGAVVSSLVDDVIMQIIGAIFGQPSFNAISIHWGKEITDTVTGSGVTTKYAGLKHAYEHQIFIGALITKLVDFVIVGLVLFFLVKAVNKMKRPQEVVVVAGPTEVDLLTEIRDSLRTR
jgi:large conductance mechanosensitive channel